MNWIQHCSYIPFWKRNDPNIQRDLDMTYAMNWIIYNKTDIPYYLRHDPTIQNRYGYTCLLYWIQCSKVEIPHYVIPN